MPSAAWLRRPPRRLLGGRLPDQRLLDRPGPQRRRAHVGQPDPGLGDRAAVGAHRRRDGHDRPLVGDPHELLVVRAPAGVLGDPHLGEDLVLADRGLEEVDEEVVGRHRPGAAGDRRSRTPRPAPAPAPRGRRPGRRGPAPRRRCRGAAPAGRPPCSAALASSSGVLRDQRVGRRPRGAVVIAPMTIASPSSRMPRRDSIRPRSMTTSGALSRIRSTGSRLCPPAMILASSPCSASAAAPPRPRSARGSRTCGDHAPAPSCCRTVSGWSKCGIAAPSWSRLTVDGSPDPLRRARHLRCR